MSLLKKIKRVAGLPDISQRKIREFLVSTASAETVVAPAGKEPTLALVVPCYGHARFLETMLKSITNQTRVPDEVIIVDDCSPDGSGDVLERLIGTLEENDRQRYRLLRNDRNLGQAASLNRAIGDARSDLIMILNDDDYLMHDAAEVSLTLFGRYPEVVLIGGTSIHFTGDDELARADKNISSHVDIAALTLDVRCSQDVLTYRSYNDLNMTHSGCCFLKSAWERAGGYYPDKRKRLVPFSDRDFQLRVNALFPVAVSHDVPFSFWRSDSSVDNGLDS